MNAGASDRPAARRRAIDLLEANHWELADKYLTERYIQHNPNAASGRAGVIKFFTEVMKVKPASSAGFGGTAAAPVAREVLQAAL